MVLSLSSIWISLPVEQDLIWWDSDAWIWLQSPPLLIRAAAWDIMTPIIVIHLWPVLCKQWRWAQFLISWSLERQRTSVCFGQIDCGLYKNPHAHDVPEIYISVSVIHWDSDVSNDWFANWLPPRRTHSCCVYVPAFGPEPNMNPYDLRMGVVYSNMRLSCDLTSSWVTCMPSQDTIFELDYSKHRHSQPACPTLVHRLLHSLANQAKFLPQQPRIPLTTITSRLTRTGLDTYV